MVTGTVEVEPFEFSSDHFVTYKHSGIGSGRLIIILEFLNEELDLTQFVAFSSFQVLWETCEKVFAGSS